jgi:signal transduction histidine kinase
MKYPISLHKLIYKNYLSSSLVPIFAIEILLLLLYFGVSYFITQKSQELLQDEATQNLVEITKREAQNINAQLEEVSRLGKIMQADHQNFFSSSACFLPNKEPVFARHPNGAYYKTEDNGGSSLYYTASTKLGEREKRQSRCSEMLDPLMKNIVDTHPLITQAYLNTHDTMNRLYPFMKDVFMQYGAILDVTVYNFYYLADSHHNPKKESVWTSAYLDPAGQGWMISNITPIYNGAKLEGVSGLDVTIDSFVRNTLEVELPWGASAFMIDKEGVILAMPKEVEKIFNLKELKEHSYAENISQTIEKPKSFSFTHMQSFLDAKADYILLPLDDKEYIIAQKVVAETGWRLMILLDKATLFAPMQKLKTQIDFIGYFVIFFMGLFYLIFFLYLQKKSQKLAQKIVTPIEELSILSKDLGTNANTVLKSDSGIEEVDQLTHNFNTLSKELDTRTQAYIEAQLREKMHEKDAEIAYRAGLFESASSYLHNIGNAITVLNSKVRLMRNVTQALSKTSLGFQRLFKLVDTSSATQSQKEELRLYIEEFDRALSENIVTEIQSISDTIAETTSHASESIRHQQDDFNDSSAALANYAQRFALKPLLESIINDYHLSCVTKGIEVTLEAEANIEIELVIFQLHSGLSNIFKISIESREASQNIHHGLIHIALSQTPDFTTIEISDNGSGVTQQNLSKMFSSGFTTKTQGHGLGLHAFNNFLRTHKSSISLLSEGKDKGATVTIHIGETQR